METWELALAVVSGIGLLIISVRLYRRRRRRAVGRTAPVERAADEQRIAISQRSAASQQPRIVTSTLSNSSAQFGAHRSATTLHTAAVTSSGRGQLPPVKGGGGRLKSENVQAALRERAAMREQEDREYAIALSRSINQHERPGEAAAAAAAAAAMRAGAAPPGLRPQRPQLAPIGRGSCGGACHGGSQGGGGLPPLSAAREARQGQRSAAFNAAVEARFNEWSTEQYAQSSYLHEIGRTARDEKREDIREQVEREWRASGRPIFVEQTGVERKFANVPGPGRRLGGSSD